MADPPEPFLSFNELPRCLPSGVAKRDIDPGYRSIAPPRPLPEIGDDFDWQLRDYDGFREFMLAELQVDQPERRWSAADLEVVLVELLAAALDQLSDAADRVAAESTLATARRPQSVIRWLTMIGFDRPLRSQGSELERLIEHYRANPARMDEDRRDGPRAIRNQQRMASLSDHGRELERHPLVFRASAERMWSGAWPIVRVAVVLWQNIPLDQPASERAAFSDSGPMSAAIERFHLERGLHLAADWAAKASARDLLQAYLDGYRLAGQPVVLVDAIPVGISLSLCVRVAPTHFVSEVRRSILSALGPGPGGFFEPGRNTFGQDVWASDIYERVGGLAGVRSVRVEELRRVDREGESEAGVVRLAPLEVAVLDNDPRDPARGRIELVLAGGQTG